MVKKIIGLEHRSNGVLGYQLPDGKYVAILKAPKGKISNVKVRYDDPYNWRKKKGVFYWVLRYEQHFENIESDQNYDYFKFILNNREKRFKYFFVFKYKDQEYSFGEFGFKKSSELGNVELHQFSFTWNFSSIGKLVSPQEWWTKTSWYQIFPDRFASSNNMLENYIFSKGLAGGNIKGIITKLDYIKELGFNGIYLNPIFLATSSHKYDTIDYFKIDSDFGTMEDFETLVAELKKRNMRIMLDGVFNHCGFEFFQWQDVLKNKEKSKFVNWFHIWNINKVLPPSKLTETDFSLSGESKGFGTFGNNPKMPRLNWDNIEVQDFILEVIDFWTKKGIDAWRMDVADEVSFDMWRKVREKAKLINKEIQLLGEVWYDSSLFLNGDQFDSTMNYLFRYNALKYFSKKEYSLDEFLAENIEAKYRYSELINLGLFNMVGTHDTKRILDATNGDKIASRKIIAWLLLNPGSISFYYNDEHDDYKRENGDNRQIFSWDFDENNITYNLVKEIMSFRKKHIEKIINSFCVTKDNENLKVVLGKDTYVTFLEKKLNINGKLFNLE